MENRRSRRSPGPDGIFFVGPSSGRRLCPPAFVVPRTAGTEACRYPQLAADGIHGPPDLVIEVLSPATAQLDKKQKRLIYAKAGVKYLWLVDPLLRQIQRYDFARDTAKPVDLIEENETFSTPLLPGLSLAAAAIFKR